MRHPKVSGGTESDPGTSTETNFGTTWPLFSQNGDPPFPGDARLNVTPFRPASAELEALEQRTDLPETTERAEAQQRELRESFPPVAPDWVRAARTLAAWLNERVARGSLSPLEEAALSRTWAAFSLSGSTVPQILRVAHVISRAHSAIRATPRGESELQAAVHDCAGVLHAGLPTAVRERMPMERAIQVVRGLRTESDPWAAVVQGVSELLGWSDYARAHAAAAIRTAMERGS